MPLFFTCSYPPAPRSVVEPGNWGRFKRMYVMKDHGKAFLIAREFIFETVRLREFGHAPSRLEAIFLCKSADDLTRFQASTNRTSEIGYAVELVNPDAPVVEVWIDMFDAAKAELPVSRHEEFARWYWSGLEVKRPEVLTTSPIRILSRLS